MFFPPPVKQYITTHRNTESGAFSFAEQHNNLKLAFTYLYKYVAWEYDHGKVVDEHDLPNVVWFPVGHEAWKADLDDVDVG